MSYCRFSCDDWKSDVYVYKDVNGGWTTMVAACRYVGKARKRVKDIGLPHDQAVFRDRTRKATVARLVMLRKAGYHVPKHALSRLRAEIRQPRTTSLGAEKP